MKLALRYTVNITMYFRVDEHDLSTWILIITWQYALQGSRFIALVLKSLMEHVQFVLVALKKKKKFS